MAGLTLNNVLLDDVSVKSSVKLTPVTVMVLVAVSPLSTVWKFNDSGLTVNKGASPIRTVISTFLFVRRSVRVSFALPLLRPVILMDDSITSAVQAFDALLPML